MDASGEIVGFYLNAQSVYHGFVRSGAVSIRSSPLAEAPARFPQGSIRTEKLRKVGALGLRVELLRLKEELRG